MPRSYFELVAITETTLALFDSRHNSALMHSPPEVTTETQVLKMMSIPKTPEEILVMSLSLSGVSESPATNENVKRTLRHPLIPFHHFPLPLSLSFPGEVRIVKHSAACALNRTYDAIVHWMRNVFKTNAGTAFVCKLS